MLAKEKKGLLQDSSSSFAGGGAGGKEWQEFYYFLTRIRKCQWFKIPLLGEVETAVRLGIKSRWGLPQMTPF